MTKDWKKPKASHKHVVCERVDLFWLQDVSKENWDDTSKASDWLLIGRMDGGTSASPHYSFTQGCQTYGLRATSSPQDNLMWIINDLSVCGSRSFSPAEHPCRYGWVFIFLWPCGKSHANLCERRKRGRRSKTASVAGTGQVHRETGNWIQACREKWKSFFQWYWRHSWVQIV